jgi:hypothetical protein
MRAFPLRGTQRGGGFRFVPLLHHQGMSWVYPGCHGRGTSGSAIGGPVSRDCRLQACQPSLLEGDACGIVRISVSHDSVRLHPAAARGLASVGLLVRLWSASEYPVHCRAAQ